jgi:hypothetical protein
MIFWFFNRYWWSAPMEEEIIVEEVEGIEEEAEKMAEVEG